MTGSYGWWFGLNDIAVEGTLVYTDGTPLDYLFWLGANPDGGVE